MRKRFGGINTGTSLLLVIFVTMCVTTFAVLSYTSAVSDSNLSKQARERTKEYYSACNRAEERIALYKKNIESAKSFMTDEDGGKYIEFTEEYGDNHYLKVRIKVEDNDEYIIEEWTTNYKKQ